MPTARRDSDTKRHTSSKYDREPSPKRSRNDGRHDADRGRSNADGDIRHSRDYDQKRRRRAEDHLPLQAPSSKAEDVRNSRGGSDKKTEDSKDSDKKVDVSKESEKKENGSQVDKKRSSEPAEMPRSRSHFQHDDRGYTRRPDSNSYQRASSGQGWGKDSRDRHGDADGEASRYRNYVKHYRDDKITDRERGERAWRHDGFFELEANPSQPAFRKRPAFSEQKIAVEDDKKERLNNSDRDERGSRIHQHFDRSRGARRAFSGDREVAFGGERQSFGPASRDRFASSGGNYLARDRTNARQEFHTTGPSDKWKHDMFSEANRSPTPKNEDDQIAKIEALLAS